MMYSQDICRLVLENVTLVEETQQVLAWLDNELIKNIWEFIENRFTEKNYFKVGSTRDGDHFFWSVPWDENNDGTPPARFWLDCEGNGCEENSWLSVLGGLASDSLGGLFLWYDWREKGFNKKEWKMFLHNFFIKNPLLQDNGFVLNSTDTAIVKPLKINLGCLAENLKDPQDCFDAIGEALDAIYAQREIFKNLFAEINKYNK